MQHLKGFAIIAMAVLASVACQSVRSADQTGEEQAEIWKDPSKPLEDRVRDLMSRMTDEEKVSQISCNAVAIPRLGIKSYSMRNECLHGVATGAVDTTVFPQAIGMAATWDTALIKQEGDTISTEARAIHNDYIAKHDGNSWEHTGLTYYSPNINIVRDPRWGRGQETYGEDPFLTGQMGVAFITGLQGDDPRYVKIIACAKHYAVHSGPEPLRHVINMDPTPRDLRETYLPAFEAAVKEGHVGSVMGAYSSLYGIPCCASPFLLNEVLRKEWGFDGFVVSDGGAIWDIWAMHHYVPTAEAAAVAAVHNGCDVASGGTGGRARRRARQLNPNSDPNQGVLRGGDAFKPIADALKKGEISEADLDRAVHDELMARFRVGIFDPADLVPYSKITMADVDTQASRDLAQKVGEESIVLLKNDGVLPLKRQAIKHIAVIGPNADAAGMLLGNYHGKASKSVTILDGIKQIAGEGVDVTYVKGCPLAMRIDKSNAPSPDDIQQAVSAAKAADVVIYVGGIDADLEGEEFAPARNVFDGFKGGDRTRIELPDVQGDLIKSLCATGKPVVVVNCSGCAMAMPWEAQHVPAIVQAWYPGEQGGTAVAKVLFGDVDPAGRLPVTFYQSTSDLPEFTDYSMKNRTYKYFTGKPLYAFGHGLSYTKFDYGHVKTHVDGQNISVVFKVRNTGKCDGDEVPQIYFSHIHSAAPQAQIALCGFTRVHVARGQSATVTINIPRQQLRYWDTDKNQYVVEPGKYKLLIGSASDDIRAHSTVTIK